MSLAGFNNTGYTADTPEHYMIDSATLYKNVTFNKSTNLFSGTLIGATNGGVEVDITQKYRDVEVDGTYWTPVKGNKALSNTEVTAKTNIKEFTAENLSLAINGSITTATADEAPAGYTVVNGKRFVDDSDYINNVAIVGKISGTDKPIIFMLDNVLATAGAKIKTKDDEEAEIPVELTAHASYDQLINNAFPYRIYYPQVGTTITAIAFEPAATAAKIGVQKSLVLKTTPVNLPVPEGIYNSSDATKATISQSGVLTPIAAGTTTVTWLSKDGRLSTTTVVTVTA